jgi:aspartyl-tRNA(Asn)/glutamyl-tRNA(Gln) amidotransferase subunit A
MNGRPTHPWQLTIIDAASLLRARSLSAVELVESTLQRLDETEPAISAWVEVMRADALSDASRLDAELALGQTRGPLHGIPVAIKDIYDVAGVPTRCGSRAKENAASAMRDAETVRRLREAGAIVLGKTVTQEFAAGVISAPCRNPWNPDRVPGGSSGGTAAAIAAGSALAGLGSDTGGSIRIPAAVCGVVGLKPTYGTVSLDGVYPLAWSLDTAGPLARTVEDARLIYRLIRSSARAGPIVERRDGFRVGVPRPHFFDRLQPGVSAAVESAIAAMREAGITIVETPWKEAASARACSFIINRVETAAVHLIELEKHGDLYGDELRRRIEANALFPATGYVRALQARGSIKRSAARLFTEYDLDALVTPATPGVAALADRPVVPYGDGSEEHVSLAYTRLSMPFNVTGQPALSLPCGFDADGLPVGLQLAGRPHGEEALCNLARRVEEALGLGVRLPEMPAVPGKAPR